MATNFGTKIALTGFVFMIATRRLVMDGGFSGRPTQCSYCLQLSDVAMTTTFWLSMGYNFSCIIASDTLFDSRGGF